MRLHYRPKIGGSISMKKRITSFLLAAIMLLGLLPSAAFAADSVEEALGEVNIYNGGYPMSYPHEF